MKNSAYFLIAVGVATRSVEGREVGCSLGRAIRLRGYHACTGSLPCPEHERQTWSGLPAAAAPWLTGTLAH